MATVLKTEIDVGEDIVGELDRIREENREMAVTLGAFSAFLAARGLLDEAWHFIHNVHQINDESD